MAGQARAYSGRLVRLAISDGLEPEAFTLIAGLRTTALRIDNDAVDVTTVASEGFRELLPQGGLRALAITGDGIVAAGASDRALYLQAVQADCARYRLDFGNGDRFEGPFLITRFQRSGSQADAESFAITLESAGAVTFTQGEEEPS